MTQEPTCESDSAGSTDMKMSREAEGNRAGREQGAAEQEFVDEGGATY